MRNPGADNKGRKLFRRVIKIFGVKLTAKLYQEKELIKETWNNIDRNKLNFFLNFHKQIPGWLSIRPIKVILALDNLLSENSVKGDITEIGVYSGRSSILFWILNENTNAKFYFCDNFTKARLKHFKFYIKHLVSKEIKVNIFAKKSEQLTEDELSSSNKMIHIDGSHDFEPVYRDMALCSTKLAEKGVLIMDDYLNSDYPGANLAINKFLKDDKTITPFLYCFGKLFCCRSEDREWFESKMDSLISSELLKDIKFNNVKFPLLDYQINCLTL